MPQDDCLKISMAVRSRRRLSPEEEAQPERMKACNPKTWSQEQRDSQAAFWKRCRAAKSQGKLLVLT